MKNKRWYSLFLAFVMLISTVVQPVQTVLAVTTSNSVAEAMIASDESNEESEKQAEETHETVSSTESAEVLQETAAEVQSTEKVVEETASTTQESSSTTESSTTESSVEEEEESIDRPDAPINIKDYLKLGEEFLTGVEIAIKSADGSTDIDYKNNEQVPSDARINLDYQFAIPNRLLTSGLLKSGDFYEFDLPSALKLENKEGYLPNANGVSFGTYKLSNGKLRFTFNEAVETLSDIKGHFNYSQQLKEELQAGEAIIKVPLERKEESIKVNLKPSGGKDITKNVNKSSDNKKIDWTVSVNTNLSTLENATVTDDMPSVLIIDQLTVQEQTVNLKGEVVSVNPTPLVENIDYKVDGKVVTFIGQYANTNKSFKLTYETSVDQDKIPATGGNINYFNKAVLNNKGITSEATADTWISYGRLIQKFEPNKTNDPGYVYEWLVKYNFGLKDLPKNSYIEDTLVGTNLEYIEDSVVVKNIAGKELVKDVDYTVTFIGKQMKVVFPNGLSEAVDVTYKTEVPFVVDGSTTNVVLENKVKTEGATDDAVGTIQKDGLIKYGRVDYDTRQINWQIEVNRHHYDMVDWSLTDIMSAGQSFNKESFTIYDETAKRKLVENTDYRFISHDGTSFNIEFMGELKTKTNHNFTITYSTDFERGTKKFTNTATDTWYDVNKGKHTQGAPAEVDVNDRYIKNGTKDGSYDAQKKELTWKIIVNYNQDTITNGKISDKILDGQKYVADSAKIYKGVINPSNGNVTYDNKKELSGFVNYADDTVTANLPEGSKDVYVLIFKTSLEGTVIGSGTYSNKAIYETNGKSMDLSASATVANGGVYGAKEGAVDSGNSNFVNWKVKLNPSQSAISDFNIVDKPSNNQIIDESSITIYETTVAANGNITKKADAKLVKDVDYTLDIKTNNETGQQEMTLNFLSNISKAYILEYRTLISSNKAHDEVNNEISFSGNNEQVKSTVTSKKVRVSSVDGSASGLPANVEIVKIDKNTSQKTPLAGAHFELRTARKNGQVVRSGVTDATGKLRFGNLQPGKKYYLFETKAPNKFNISWELKEGKEISLKGSEDTTVYQALEIENDIPRVTFKKINGRTGAALSGAAFAIKNAKGEFYNGINDQYDPQWVAKASEVSKEVQESLVSKADGNVEVAGLPVGNYLIQELKAPEGYDLLLKDIPFEVVSDAGMLKLKNTVTVSNNEYETTSLSIKKIWKDANNQDGKRPKIVTFKLLANGKEITEASTKMPTKLELTSSNQLSNDLNVWEKTFSNLRKYDNEMKEIKYTIQEVVEAPYTASALVENPTDHFELTNSYTPETTKISGTKEWKDASNQDGKRPTDITVNLLADGKKVTSDSFSGKSTDKTWSYSFENLPKYRDGGQEIVYTVTEEAVPDYTTTISGLNITNTYAPETTKISGTKEWDDADNQDGKRPANIRVNLLADGTQVASELFSGKSTDKAWNYSFENLPKYHDEGKEIIYTVTEEAVSGYTTAIDGLTIKNTHKPETTKISGIKEWDDADNQDGKRPTEIRVNLLADGKQFDSQVFSGKLTDKTWDYSFENLPKYHDEGKEIIYTVTEEAVPNYTTAIDGLKITNTYTPETTTVSGTKEWDDADNQDGKRPTEIRVNLLADGKQVDSQLFKGNSTEKTWNYSFTNLSKYRDGGKEIIYTVTEEAVPSYTTAIDGLTITNTHTPETTTVSGTKEWDDADNQDGKRPTEIRVNLLADGKQIDSQLFSGKATDNTWTYDFKDLPKYRNEGTEILYTVTEEKVSDYTTTIDGLTITNTHQPALRNIDVVKEWDDANNQDGIRPLNISVQLYANGVAEGTPRTLNALNYWTGTFTNLAVNQAGKEIDYTVKEVGLPTGYTASISPIIDGAITITNRHDVSLIDIPVKKIWRDVNNQDGIRPGKVMVRLLADGVEVDHKEIVNNATIDLNTWTGVFTDKPEYKEGKKILYTVTEDAIENYTSEVRGYEITNSYTPGERDISVQKVWNDADNQDGIRPDDIKVALYADGVATGKFATLTKDSSWHASFKKLAIKKAGVNIKYEVKEIMSKFSQYAPKIEEKTAGNFTVTNSYTTKKVSFSATKEWNDGNNQDGVRPTSVKVQLYQNSVAYGQPETLNDANNWSTTWTELDENAQGELIDYTVEEIDVDTHYVATVKEDTENQAVITNTHTPELLTLSGTKEWDDADNQDGLRPEKIMVNLLADGEVVASQEVSGDLDVNTWSYSFKDLPKYKEVGKEIVYSVTEEAVADYTSRIDEFIITNTHTPELRDINVTKVWDDANNQDGIRPEMVEVELYANGEATGQIIQLDETTKWAGTFADLDVKKAGTAIEYTVKEVETLAGYTASVTEETVGQFVITNTHSLEVVTVSGKKTWDDENDKDGIRPDSITLHLLSDNEEAGKLVKVQTIKVTAADKWEYAIEDLPKYAENEVGREVSYVLEEEAVEGYTALQDGYNFTNVHEVDSNVVLEDDPEDTNKEQSKPTTSSSTKKENKNEIFPQTGELQNAFSYLGVAVLAFLGVWYRKKASKEK